ncbi:YadA-like family protein [Salmonella enterica]|nr:YadA-like family protein [Salmonella enterica]
MKINKITFTPIALFIMNGINPGHTQGLPVTCYENNLNRTFTCAAGATTVDGKNSLAIGSNAKTNGERAIAIGAPDNGMYDIDNITPRNTSAVTDGIAIGAGATVRAPGGIAIGSRRNSPSAGNPLRGAANSSAVVNAIGGIAIGSGAVTGQEGNNDSRSIAIGDLASVSGNLNIGLGSGLVVGSNSDRSISIGNGSAIGRQKSGSGTFESASKTVALGYGAEVMKGSDKSVSIGSEAKVLQETTQSVALGNNAIINAGGLNSVAIGSYTSTATGVIDAVAIGGGQDRNSAATANANAAIAIGNNTSASGVNSIVIGKSSTVKTTASDSLAIGSHSESRTKGSIAIGTGAMAGREDILTLKDSGQPERTWIGKENNIALGAGAVADGGRVISIGENAGNGTTDNWNIHNINIGTNAGSNAKRDYSVALGFEAGMVESDLLSSTEDSNRTSSINIGRQAGKNTASYGNISVGDNAGANITDSRSVTNIIIGKEAGKGLTSDDGKNLTFAGFGPGGNTLIGTSSGRKLSGDSNVAIGSIAADQATGDNNIYVGHLAGQQSKSDRSIIIGSHAGLKTNNDRSVLIGNFANGEVTTKTRNVVGLGSSVKATGFESIALGFNAHSLADNAIAMGRMAKASGKNATALSTTSQAEGENSVAIGYNAKAMAENTISIGTGNTVSGRNSGAIGDPSSVSGNNSYSLGNNNTITASNAFILGNTVSSAVDNSVVLGNRSTVSAAIGTSSYTVNGVSHSFSGSVPVSTVSIGASGMERTLTNLAAGQISATSTDAINGSQLFAVTSEVDKGSLFSGNTGSFSRQLGEVTTISGGLATDATASNKNIRTEAKDGLIDIQLADNLDVTSVKAGNTLVNNNGLHIIGGPSVTTDGVDAGSRSIRNVGDAVDDTDAVNKRQLDNLSSTVNKGWRLQTNGASAETVAPGDTVNITDGENIQVTRTGKSLNIATARKVNFDNVAIGNIVIDKDTGKISGLSEGEVSVDSKDAVTGAQLFKTSEKVAVNTRNIAANKAQLDNGINFAGNTGSFNRQLGEVTTISGGLAADATASNKNIRTEAKDGLIDIQLADNLDVTSVKAGNTLVNNNGLHIIGGPSVTADGVDAGSRSIRNVGDAVNDTDAVNKRQLDNLSTIVGQGLTFAANEGSNISRKPGDILTLKGDAITKGNYSGNNIKTVTDISTGMISIRIAESPVFGSVVINDNNSGKITGVNEGVIASGSKDVVNGEQIHRITTSIGNVIGGNTHITPDGNLMASNIGNTGKNTIHDAIAFVRNTAETASAGWNLSVNGQESSSVKPKDTVDLNNKDGNISISKSNNQVSFDLSEKIKVKESISIENGPSLTRTGIDGGDMKITNVADGVIAAGSKDAVNGGQIHDFVSGETTRPITFTADSGSHYEARLGATLNVKGDDKNIRTTIDGNKLSVRLNESVNVKSVRATDSLSVSSGAIVDMGGNTIHNVGNATRPGDAVNYGQFQQAFSRLGNQINRVERRANAGTAAAIATAGLTQAYIPGKSMMSVSGGTFQGESSVAIGLSTISDNGNWVLKGSFSSTTRNQTGASVGVGFQF